MAVSRDARDLIGARGEALFFSMLLKPVRARPPGVPSDGFLFSPQFLGEKWPLTDHIVELRIAGSATTPFFFVQVRTTNSGYTRRDNRLKVGIDATKIQGLAAYPAPTYIAGIDARAGVEQGYLVSANGENLTRLSSLSTAFPLDDEANRLALWNEIRLYWQTPPQPKLVSAFHDQQWR